MKFLVTSCLVLFCLSFPVAGTSTQSTDTFGFYQDTVSVKLVRGRGNSASAKQVELRVTYAQEGDRFILSIEDTWLFYGEITQDGDRVKLYDLDDGVESGDGKCRLDGCKLWFKWNIGRRSSARGRIVTKFIDDNTLELTFGMTGYWFWSGPEKIDFTSKLKRSASASEECNLPETSADLSAWIDYCSSL